MKRILTLLTLILLTFSPRAETLVWNPNTETDLAGYVVYSSTNSADPAVLASWAQVGSVPSTTTNLTLTLQPGVMYYFYVVAYNQSFLTSAPSEVISYLKPGQLTKVTIVGQSPSTGTFAVGSGTTLFVTATGSPPIGYKWYKNGLEIVGATNATLVFSNLSTNDTAAYMCRANNSASFEFSKSMTIRVLPGFPSLSVFNVRPARYTNGFWHDVAISFTTLSNLRDYDTTNYFLVRSSILGSFTNVVAQSPYILPMIPVTDYTFSAYISNSLGTSPIVDRYFLNGKNPTKPTGVLVVP